MHDRSVSEGQTGYRGKSVQVLDIDQPEASPVSHTHANCNSVRFEFLFSKTGLVKFDHVKSLEKNDYIYRKMYAISGVHKGLAARTVSSSGHN